VTGDRSADANSYLGIFAQLYGVMSGGYTITASGCYLKNLAGKLAAAVGMSQPDLDDALTAIYFNQLQTDDVRIVMGSGDRKNLNRAFGDGATTTIFRAIVPVGSPEQSAVTGGVFVDGYIHPVTSRRIPIETDPNMAQGTILIVPESFPYPNTEIPAPTAVWTLDEWFQYEYALIEPTRNYENQCIAGVACYAPVAYAIIFNVYNG
jgi:hypothetical protein